MRLKSQTKLYSVLNELGYATTSLSKAKNKFFYWKAVKVEESKKGIKLITEAAHEKQRH
jgi:hypothetical protein